MHFNSQWHFNKPKPCTSCECLYCALVNVVSHISSSKLEISQIVRAREDLWGRVVGRHDTTPPPLRLQSYDGHVYTGAIGDYSLEAEEGPEEPV